jgi:4-amino-4-deoxy-L-arabinose transferase-like glycosyltransferase
MNESHAAPRSDPDTNFLNRRAGLSTGVALLVAAAVLLPLLGHKALADWDEGIYAGIAKNLALKPSLTLYWNFQPWFEKPPLYMWLTAACFRIFAVNEFWARAVAALSGVAITGIIHGLMARVRGLAAAWVSTVVLLTTLGFVRACHLGEVDTLLTLGCCLALWGVARVRASMADGREARGWFLFWFGFAVAVMTKGAAAVVIPLTVVVLLVWERWPLRAFGRRFWLGLLLFLALVLPWHVAMYHEYGTAFLREYLGEQTIARATTQLERHNNPPWFFAEMLLGFASPCVFVFLAAAWGGRRRREWREFTAFALVVFAVFTVSQTRLPRYIVPMYPAMALVAADGIFLWVTGSSKKVWRSWLVVSLAAVASFALAVVLTKGLRERLTSRSTTSGVMHADRGFLPLLRISSGEPVADPILLCDDSGRMELPAALFYTGRRVQQVWLLKKPDQSGRVRRYFDPQPLGDFVGATPRLLMIRQELASSLPASMRFTELRADGDLVIGTVISR